MQQSFSNNSLSPPLSLFLSLFLSLSPLSLSPQAIRNKVSAYGFYMKQSDVSIMSGAHEVTPHSAFLLMYPTPFSSALSFYCSFILPTLIPSSNFLHTLSSLPLFLSDSGCLWMGDGKPTVWQYYGGS